MSSNIPSEAFWYEGYYYTGPLKDGKLHGTCKQYTVENGYVGESVYNNGKMMFGYGWITYKGKSYVGYIRNGLPDGQGTLYDNQKPEYRGTWLEGKKYGKGVEFGKTTMFHGAFDDDKKSGYGILYVFDERTQTYIASKSGTWVRNQFHTPD